MNTTCQHCRTPMQSQRATKKYCSEQCKQQAFYLRSGLELSTTTNIALRSIPLKHDEQELEDQPEPDIKQPAIALPASESKYEYEGSRLVNMIIEFTDNSPAFDLFRKPEQHWGYLNRENVDWINIRFRSIIESLLQFAANHHIKAARLIAVTEALRQMLQARQFRFLPANYPFTQAIKEMASRMADITSDMKGKQSIMYRLTVDRKVEFIGMRYLLAGIAPLVPFGTLQFDR